jgi:hypothetical protein
MNFIELTHEDGHRIILSLEEIAQVAPLGGDEDRGCAVTFKRHGVETASRHIRVRERLSALSASLRPLRPRNQIEFRLSWGLNMPQHSMSETPAPKSANRKLHVVPQPRFGRRIDSTGSANRP